MSNIKYNSKISKVMLKFIIIIIQLLIKVVDNFVANPYLMHFLALQRISCFKNLSSLS